MAIIYRTTGAWGTGLGANLTAAQVDNNFYELAEAITALEENPTAPAEITNITQSGTVVTVHLSNGSSYNLSFETSSTVLAADVVTITGTVFTPALAAAQAYHRCTNAAGCAVTIPPNSSVAFPVKTELHFRQADAGPVTIEAGSGVTLNGITGYDLTTAAEGGVVTAKKIATDEWDVFGNLLPT